MKSVLSQDWAEVEYLVVDPGSTDDTAEIIRSFQSKYPGRIIHLTERDNGPADGLNRAFARATGDLFGYLNADDYYLPGCFQSAAAAAQQFPNSAAVYGDGFTVDGEGRLLRRVVSTKFSAKRFVYGGALVLQQSTFYRADAFRAVGGFNTENRTSWDAELLFDMSLRNMELLHVPGYWSAFRIHSESITGSQRLAGDSRKTHARYFRAVMGREKKSLDKLAAKFVFAYTLLTEPRGLMTRVSDRLKSVISNPKTKKLGQKNLAYRG
jgi:glycosyltransferase involved in cell wall biosynthesis